MRASTRWDGSRYMAALQGLALNAPSGCTKIDYFETAMLKLMVVVGWDFHSETNTLKKHFPHNAGTPSLRDRG